MSNGKKWRAALDAWFPTIVRYLGVAILIVAIFWDKGRQPGLITAALGMIAFKTVWGKGPPDESA